MTGLSDYVELMRELDRAVEAAPTVKRPEGRELVVGDDVIVYGPRVRRCETVQKVGTAWITVSNVRFRFRRGTLKTQIGVGSEWWLKTPEQDEYDSRISAARTRLQQAGVAISSVSPIPDGQILAYAALAELLGRDAR